MSRWLTRRRFTHGGGTLLAALAVPLARAAPGVVEIDMLSDEEGARVSFDPIGVMLHRGQTVRWRCQANYHTTTAYHPANERRSLRIPRRAVPWASDVLSPGETFEVTLDVEGVYDYCCVPHEEAGMVGRLVVGHATGPGSQPFDWFTGRAEARSWRPVPPAARAAFPPISDISKRKVVSAQLFQADW
jgi:plastocyanin